MDASEGRNYLLRYGDFSFREQGMLMQILMSSHSTLEDELKHRLEHLQDVLEQADLELRNAAKHYEDTDADSAARVDATYPPVHRPTPR